MQRLWRRLTAALSAVCAQGKYLSANAHCEHLKYSALSDRDMQRWIVTQSKLLLPSTGWIILVVSFFASFFSVVIDTWCRFHSFASFLRLTDADYKSDSYVNSTIPHCWSTAGLWLVSVSEGWFSLVIRPDVSDIVSVSFSPAVTHAFPQTWICVDSIKNSRIPADLITKYPLNLYQ